MAIKNLLLNTILLGSFVLWTNHGVDGSEHSMLRRDQQLRDCGIIDFSLYNPGNQSFRPLNTSIYYDKARIRLDQYKDGKVNIIANVGKPCKSGTTIRCVKLDFAGDTRKERIAPYALYGDKVGGELYARRPKRTGWHRMSASPYSDKNCTKKLDGSYHVDVHVVPYSNVSFPLTTYSVVFQSTTGPVSAAQTSATTTLICDYLREAVYWFVYKRTYIPSGFACTGTPKSSTVNKPLQIDIAVKVKYALDDYVGQYDTSGNLPNVTGIDDWFTKVLTGKQNNGPDYPNLYVKLTTTLPSSNPYAKATSLTLSS